MSRSESLQRYHALNLSFGSPLVLHLSQRGFFSEVNMAIGAIIYGLAQRRRVIITQRRFNDLSWNDFFASDLPGGDGGAIDLVPPQWQLRRVKSEGFSALLAWLKETWTSGARLTVEELGITGDLDEVKRAVCKLFCELHPAIAEQARSSLQANGLVERRFAAVHVRRGDKILVHERKGQHWSEGEDTPAAYCAELIAAAVPGVRDVFILTDDYRAVEELRATGHGFRVVSLCPQEESGHHQAAFNDRGREEKVASIRRLLVEVEIASKSCFFAGGFKSNIPKHVACIHPDPDRCVSTDSRKECRPF